MKFRKGDAVEITIHAGLVNRTNERRFVDDCAPGTRGHYEGPHRTLRGWHMVMVGDLLAPLASGQFRRAEEGQQQ